MTIHEALLCSRIHPLDAELLLAHVLKESREHLLAHPEERLRPAALRRFRGLVARRRKHEPVAFLIGHKHFYDLTLAVAPGVLIPRPETEMLVEEAIATAPKMVIDVGTGSGAISLALAKHLPKTRVIATDLSLAALRLARKNAQVLGLSKRVRFVRADMLQKQGGKNPPLQPDMIVANLPYLPTAVWRSAPPDVKQYEPRSALDGGRDGLDAYRRLFAMITHQGVMNHALTTVLIEIDPSQKRILPVVVKRFFPKGRVTFKKDLAGRWRVAVIHP
ncbi:MAG: peptide chain release factor N(5)-glutamine methyltransferase [Patescibacteria group bacterium]